MVNQGISTGANTDCRNCGVVLQDRYCHHCGQDSREPPQRAGPLVAFLTSHATGLESKALRSFRDLLFRPGRLTRDYIEGRRIRHSGPIQIYLWCTAAFFLLHAYSPFVRLNPETGAVVSTLSAVSVGDDLSPQLVQNLSEQGISLAQFAPRFDAAVSAYLPLLLVALVAVSAGLMALQFWKESLLRHAVFALHWSAFYFALETARQLLPTPAGWGIRASMLTSAIALVYLWVAMRVVYQRGWIGSTARALFTMIVFMGMLGAWLYSTSVLAARLA